MNSNVSFAKTPRVPRPVDDPIYVLWGRNGVEAEIRRASATAEGNGADVQRIST